MYKESLAYAALHHYHCGMLQRVSDSVACRAESFEVIDGPATSRYIIVCDHASNWIPPEYGDLGLDPLQLKRHIAYDIGAEALTRALSHEGKYYDFQFDFRRADRLVCTELIYRSFHAVGNLRFQPVPGTGRFYLMAEHFLDLALDGEGFEVVALYGAGANTLVVGERARAALAGTYRRENGRVRKEPSPA